jgi:RNA-binding protein
MDKHELKKKSSLLSPVVRIGKSGISDSVIAEVDKQLKLHELIKIKLLRSCLEETDRTSFASELAAKTGSMLVLVQGNVVTLFREKHKNTNNY